MHLLTWGAGCLLHVFTAVNDRGRGGSAQALSSLAQLQSQHILSPVLHGLPKWYLRLQWMLLCFARAAKKTLPLSSFLANASADLGSRVFATCLRCREQSRSKRRASQPLAPPRPPPQPLLSCPTSVATHQESRTPPAPSTPAGIPVPPSGRRPPPRRTMGVHPGFSQRAG